MMWLVSVLLIAHSCRAYDGCGKAQWRCGDVCIQSGSPCYCGGQTTFLKGKDVVYPTWCCAESNCTGIGSPSSNRDFKGSFGEGANCSAGEVLQLTKPCSKKSPSTRTTIVHKNEDLGGEATVSCNDNNDGLQIDSKVGLRSYLPCWEPEQVIRECFKKDQENDRKYDCKSRSDERPFSKQSKVVFDRTKLLEDCTTEKGKTGLTCGTECLRIDSWCQKKPVGKKGPILCDFPNVTKFYSNDKRLCSQLEFWKGKDCPAEQYRCNGAFPGQCGESGYGKINQDIGNSLYPSSS